MSYNHRFPNAVIIEIEGKITSNREISWDELLYGRYNTKEMTVKELKILIWL